MIVLTGQRDDGDSVPDTGTPSRTHGETIEQMSQKNAGNAESSAQHDFVIAATIGVTEQLARKGHQRGVVRLPATTRVDVMEAYCANCRKTYEDVADQPCSVAVIGNEHLRGGPIGVRAKRTGAAAAAVSIVQPVIKPRPMLRPVPQQQPAPAAFVRPRPMRRRRPNPIPVGTGQAIALMLPFEVDATLTG